MNEIYGPRQAEIEKAMSTRALVYGVAVVVSLLSSGVVFGWPSLLVILQREGVFMELCDDGESDCSARLLRLSGVFSAAFFSLLASRLVFGVVLDKFGPKVCSVCGLLCCALGAALFAVASSTSGVETFEIGYGLLGFGGPGVHVSSFHLSNLFAKRKRRLIISTFSGIFSASGLLFIVFRYLHESGVASRRDLFASYSGLLVFLAGLITYVQPLHTLQAGDSMLCGRRTCRMQVLRASTQASSNLDGLDQKQDNDCRAVAKKSTRLKDRKIVVQCISPLSILACLFLSVTFLHLQFYLSNIRQLLSPLGTASEVGDYLLLFNVVGSLGILAAPLVSKVLDRGFASGFSLAIMICLGFNLTTYVKVLHVQVLTFALWSVGRFCLFSTFFAFLPATFGFATFGTLNGIHSIVAATFGLLNYPLTAAALDAGSFTPVFIVLLVLQVLLFVVPILVSYRYKIWTGTGAVSAVCDSDFVELTSPTDPARFSRVTAGLKDELEAEIFVTL